MKKIKQILVFTLTILLFPIKSETEFSTIVKNSSGQVGEIQSFYNKMHHKPVWFFQGHLTKCGRVALEILQNSYVEGLNAFDYSDVVQSVKVSQPWSEGEILLTQRLLEFIAHVKGGRIDPSKISTDIKFQSPQIFSDTVLAMAMKNHQANECHQLKGMAPDILQYVQLKKILAEYRERFSGEEAWPQIETSLKAGDNNPEVLNVRKILVLHGDLNENIPLSPVFDEQVSEALRLFQKRFTLEQDGIVGGKTMAALNLSGKDLIQKVIINMERLRWLPIDLGGKYIIVNVAGYQVQGFEEGVAKITMPAIVGKPSRRTPLFYATLKNVVINPSWGVPYNILVHDKIPRIMDDPDYLVRSGFTILDREGKTVEPDEADWENEGKHYHLRQSPGKNNALGSIKFNIDNPYVIYLHGTPDEKLFAKPARAFSSGCIRLQSPTDFAAWVLNNDEQWNVRQIEAAIEEGSTRSITVSGDIGVYFIYQTVWRGADDLIYVSDDPYRMDAKMAKVFNSALIKE